MLEKIIYGGMPALYELELHTEDTNVPSRLIVMAEMLDEHQITREEVIYNAVTRKALDEEIADLGYSLRLMRPKETKKFVRPRLRAAFRQAVRNTAIDNITSTTPAKQLGQWAINSARQMTYLDMGGKFNKGIGECQIRNTN